LLGRQGGQRAFSLMKHRAVRASMMGTSAARPLQAQISGKPAFLQL